MRGCFGTWGTDLWDLRYRPLGLGTPVLGTWGSWRYRALGLEIPEFGTWDTALWDLRHQLLGVGIVEGGTAVSNFGYRPLGLETLAL